MMCGVGISGHWARIWREAKTAASGRSMPSAFVVARHCLASVPSFRRTARRASSSPPSKARSIAQASQACCRCVSVSGKIIGAPLTAGRGLAMASTTTGPAATNASSIELALGSWIAKILAIRAPTDAFSRSRKARVGSARRASHGVRAASRSIGVRLARGAIRLGSLIAVVSAELATVNSGSGKTSTT